MNRVYLVCGYDWDNHWTEAAYSNKEDAEKHVDTRGTYRGIGLEIHTVQDKFCPEDFTKRGEIRQDKWKKYKELPVEEEYELP